MRELLEGLFDFCKTNNLSCTLALKHRGRSSQMNCGLENMLVSFDSYHKDWHVESAFLSLPSEGSDIVTTEILSDSSMEEED